MSTIFRLFRFIVPVFLVLTAQVSYTEAGEKKVIAHRGSNGYLPENTLSSFVLSSTSGSDFISMELAMTADNHLVVFRDIHLTDRTNVAEIFPGRGRQDGRYYIIDFNLAELQQLSLTPETDGYPVGMRIPTFADTLALLRQMEKTLGKTISIAPEIKKPWFHSNMGKDISSATLEILQRYNYGVTTAPVLLQCYDPEELQRIHKILMAPRGIDLKLVQLIDDSSGNETQRLVRGKWVPYNSEWMFTRLGTKLVARYADAVRLDAARLLKIKEDSTFAHFLTAIQFEEVNIHALLPTRIDKNRSINPADHTDLLTGLFEQVNIDTLVTDSPKATIAFLKTRNAVTENGVPGEKQTLYIPTPLKE